MAGMNYLSMLKGTGESQANPKDVTGVLVSLTPRSGSYTFTTDSGQTITRPQTWLAEFQDGTRFDWPTYVDKTDNQVKPWSRFDPSIDLVVCAQRGIAIHVWRDERKRMHLELAAENSSVAAMAGVPWDIQ